MSSKESPKSSKPPRTKRAAPDRAARRRPERPVAPHGPAAAPRQPTGAPDGAGGGAADWDRLIASMGDGLEEFGQFLPVMFYRFTVQPDDRITFAHVSRHAELLTGFAPEEIVADPALLTDRFHPDDRTEWHKQLRETRLRRSDWLHDIRYRHRAGHYIRVRIQSRRQYEADGRVEGLGTWVDVSASKEAETQLREQEDRYRAIVEESLQGMAVTQDQRVVFANDVFAGIFGYEHPRELIGKSSLELWAPHERERMLEYWETRRVGNEAPERYEFEGVRKDGGPVWLSNRIRRIAWQGGQGSLFLVVDISGRKRAEQQAQSSDNRYRALIEDSIQGMLVVKEGTIRLVNRSFAHMFGYDDPAELNGKASHVLWAPRERERLTGYRETRGRGESAPVEYEFEGRRKDGSAVWIENRVSVIPWEGGIATQGVMLDVTARRQAEEALLASEGQYRELVEKSLQGMQVIQDGCIVFANPAEARIFGYPSHAGMIGLRTADIMAEQEMPAILRHGQDLERGEVVQFAQQRGVRKDGSPVWVQAVAARVQWQGRDAIQVFHTDVTAQVSAEQALRESERKYRDLVEGSVQGMFVHRNFRPLFVNPAFAAMCGYDSPGEILAVGDILAVVAEEERPRIRRYGEARQIGGEAPDRFEVKGARRDGREFWMQVESHRVDWNGEAAIQSTVFDITERKYAEAELQASQKRYRDLVETSLQGMAVVRDDRILFANPAEAAIFGFAAPADMIGVNILDLAEPAETGSMKERRNALMRGEQIEFVERKGRRRDGSMIWVRVSATVIPWEGGAAIQIVHSDITERKLAEQALLDSEYRFRDLVEGSLQGILIHNREGLLFANRALAEIHGYESPEELLRLDNAVRLVAPEEREQVKSYQEARVKGEPVPTRYEIRGQRKDRAQLWIEVESRIVSWKGQKAIQSTILDITERKRAAEALLESERRLIRLFESSPLAILVHEQFRPLFVNKACARLFGFSSPEMMIADGSIQFSFAPGTAERARNRNLRLLSGKEVPGRYERELYQKDGTRIWVDCSLTTIEWDGRKSMLIAYVDITERKRAEQSVLESEQRYRHLVEGTLHGISVVQDERTVFANQSEARIFGFNSPDELVGLDLRSFIEPEAQADIQARREALLRGEVLGLVERRGTRRDGSPIWLQAGITLIQWQGRPAFQVFHVDITERILAERGLRDSEQRYRALVESSLQGLTVLADDQIVFANAAEARMLGFASPDELIGRSTDEFYEQDQLEMLQGRRASLMAGEALDFVELRAMRKDGSRIWIQAGATRIQWEGRPALQAFHFDITGRKLAEHALQESEQRYRQLVEGSLQGTSVVLDGRIVYANQAEARIFGLESGQDLVGRSLDEFLSESQLPFFRRRQEALERGEKLDFVEFQAIRQDGTPIWLQGGATLTQWKGRPAFHAFILDITERKRAEQGLRASEAMLRAVLDNAPALIFIKDLANRYLLLNRTYERRTGLSETFARGKTAHELYEPELAEVFVKHDREVLAKGESIMFEESVVRGGVRHDYLSMRFPVFDSAGEISAVGGIATDITERKRSELALRASEARYRAVVENSLQGISVIGFDGIVISANNRAAEMFGLESGEQLIGLLFDQFIAPRDRPRLLERRARRARGEAVPPYHEFEGVRSDGLPVWIGQLVVGVDWEGRPAILGMYIDITERKRTEAALRTSEQRYRDLVEGSIQGIFIRNRESIVFANQAVADILGFESARAVVESPDPLAFYAPHERERIRDYAEARFNGEAAPTHFECEVIRTDGTPIWVEIQSRIVEWDGKRAVQVIMYDITERKRAEQAIRDNQGYLSAVLDTAADGIVTIAADGTIESFNREAQRIFGYLAEELIGRNVQVLVPDEHHDRHPGYIAGYLSTGVSQIIGLGRETYGRRKDTTLFPVSVSVSEVRIGERLGFSAIVKDITERKRQEQELLETARAKSVLLSSLSHELRTPLTAILGFVQLIRREAALTADQIEDVETIEASAHHLLELINDVLEVQKMEAGYVKLNREDFDLLHTMESLVAMFLPRAQSKGVSLRLEVDPAGPRYVNGDSRRLRQVLINLLSNAVKYTDQGEVRLSLAREGKQVRFGVRDTGRGIAAVDLPGLMKPFRQAAITHEGTGLGLSISKGLVEIMGGDLEVRSELGAGSEFYFSIPLSDLNSPEFEPPRRDGEAEGAIPLRVLVVEDDARLREWLMRLLRGEGYEVDQAANGREALQRFVANRADLVVTDLRMPVMDGVEFSTRLRKLPGGNRIGIFALSADLESRQSADSSGGNCFDRILAKPISADDLVEVLRVHAIRVRETARAEKAVN